MTDAEADDFDDLPTLKPTPPSDADAELEALRAKYLKPGFGFWMAVLWCVMYMVVMQIIAGFACGVPVLLIAMAIDGAQGAPLGDAQGWMKTETGILALLITLALSHIVGLLFGLLMLRWQAGKTWTRKIALARLPSKTHLALLLIGFPAMLALSTSVEAPLREFLPTIQDLLDWAKIPMKWPGIEDLLVEFRKAPLPLLIFAIAVMPGLNEEFWCRGFLGQGLSGRYSSWIVVLSVSFLFGCLHVEPRQGTGAMLLGAVIHGAYLATRSLWVAIGVHAANNGLAVFHISDQAFPILQPLEDVFQRSPALLVIGALALFIPVVIALYQTRCKLAPCEPGLPLWEPKGVSGVELPPPGSGTIVVHDPISIRNVGLVLLGALIFGSILAFA